MGFKVGELIVVMITGAVNTLKDSCSGVQDVLCGGDDKYEAVSSGISEVTDEIIKAVGDKIIPAVTTIGYSIALLFFIIAMIELITQDRLTMEVFIKFFSKLAISIFFISNSGKIFKKIFEFSTALAKEFNNIFDSGEEVNILKLYDLADKIDANYTGFPEKLGALAMAFVTIIPCYLLGLAIQIIVYLIAFSRLLEICARGSLLPISCGLLSDDGWRGAGGRYIKKLIAVCCQSSILIILGQLAAMIFDMVGNKVITTMASGGMSGFNGFFTMAGQMIVLCGVGFAMVSAMFKSIGIVNDAFGA